MDTLHRSCLHKLCCVQAAEDMEVPADTGSISDRDICALLLHHFNLDGHAAFEGEAEIPVRAKGSVRGKQPSPPGESATAVSLEDFVDKTLPLLDMEHEAEKAQVRCVAGGIFIFVRMHFLHARPLLAVQGQETVASRRPEAAQARGRALLNLRLRDAEGGLLGRTLLSLVSNKVCDALRPGYIYMGSPGLCRAWHRC